MSSVPQYSDEMKSYESRSNSEKCNTTPADLGQIPYFLIFVTKIPFRIEKSRHLLKAR